MFEGYLEFGAQMGCPQRLNIQGSDLSSVIFGQDTSITTPIDVTMPKT